MRVSVSLVEAAAAEGAAEHEGVFLEAGLVLLVVELGVDPGSWLAGWLA